MKATLKLEDGREILVDVSENDVKTLTKPDKKTGWERVKEGCNYYITESGGAVEQIEETFDDFDENKYRFGNYFTDKQLAADQGRAISLWLRIKRWAAEHCEPVNWNCQNIGKFYIFYNRLTRKVEIRTAQTLQDAFQVYFDTYENAEKCIEESRDDLLWYFTKCKDRMDG